MDHTLIQAARSHGRIAMPLRPEGENLGGNLPSTIPFLGFLDPLSRILTTKGEQRVTDPAAPLLEAPHGPA
jgi:hypothetical protein